MILVKPILQLSGLGPDAIPEETRKGLNEVMPLYQFRVEGRACVVCCVGLCVFFCFVLF